MTSHFLCSDVMFLCRLYKSLGEGDVVQGVFSSHVGTKPITQRALRREERGEYLEALRLYKEVGVAPDNHH